MEQVLSRPEASEAIQESGWRFLLGSLRTSVPVESLARAIGLATDAVVVCGNDADRHLRVDARPDRVVFTLQSVGCAAVTTTDVELALRITAVAEKSGLQAQPEIGTEAPRSVQVLEIAIDALDIAGIRPFWKAVLGYTDEVGREGLNSVDGGSAAGVMDGLADIAPALAHHIVAFGFGDIYARPGLDAKQRQLVTLGVLTALGGCERRLEVHLRTSLRRTHPAGDRRDADSRRRVRRVPSRAQRRRCRQEGLH